ncbi:allantoinase [Desulfitobacterium dichloroeliminans LMG P-21439]|uniref:Allantoinase n=1 Tax=Desulfitobacterium dichloroeliminans (strain LMG P-21439 / DCA1) TaxID=871963 RepID=L0F5Z3_DESDL|nr:allantoinase AllB [Desulfitobacterium dichloroeliminans]AGA68460.1 allantoinase [Desulfitobacterium dichloroeliminans LMG P-21439]
MSSHYDLIIRNGHVVCPDGVRKADIAVYDEKIVDIADEISGEAKEVVDATGKYVFPGTTDGHVHFNDPGRTEWETISTGSSALAAGGGVAFFDMPLNCNPCTLDAVHFNNKLAVAQKDSLVDYGFWGGLTPNNLDKLDELAECGVIGFKAFSCHSGIDEFGRLDDYTALVGMQKLAKLGLPLMVHCENAEITKELTELSLANNRAGVRDYFAARPPITEIENVSRMITFAEETGCKLIIAHISTAKAVELVTEARKRGVDVCCETIGHYLYLTGDDVERLGTVAKCSPPIRDGANQSKMWGKLFNDEIAFVSSDHSPCDPKLKDGEFMRVWGGISACQTTLQGLLTHAYHDRKFPLLDIARLTAQNVNDIFNIQGKGKIQAGYDADFALVDLNQEFTLQADDLFYKHKVSPYVGDRFRGNVTQTILRGTTIFKDGKIVSKPIGKHLKPTL